MKRINIILIILLNVISVACTDDIDNPSNNNARKDIILSRAETEIIGSQINFSINLINNYLGEVNEDEDILAISPFEAAVNLSMLSNATSPTALDEINKVLGPQKASPEQLNEVIKKISSSLPDLDNQCDINFANSCWTLPQMDFSASFTEAISNSYNAYFGHTELETEMGKSILDAWCANTTNGLITKAPIDNDPNLRFVFISIANFKGKWTTPFSKSNTKKVRFYPLTAPTYYVDMMKQELECSGFEDDEFTYISLPYGNRAYSMSLILPKNNKRSISEFASSLSAPKWHQAKENARNYTMTISLPKFKFTHTSRLKDALKRMGIIEIFENEKSLPLLFNAPCDYFVKKINQSVYIETDEDGTAASTVSVVAGGDGSVGPGKSIEFNRPFMFIIDEASTGVILFAGIANNIPH